MSAALSAVVAALLCVSACHGSPAPGASMPLSGAPGPVNAAPLIGTRGPVRVLEMSADGGWILIEQARSDTNGDGRVTVECNGFGFLGGDHLELYFVQGSGPGEPVNVFLSHDPTGRWIAFQSREGLVLRDTVARTTTLLSDVDASNDAPCQRAQPREAQFDAGGKYLMYIRLSGISRVVLVRELESGKERAIDFGSGNLWRADLSPNGRLVTAYFVTRNMRQPCEVHALEDAGIGEPFTGTPADWPWRYPSDSDKCTASPQEVVACERHNGLIVKQAHLDETPPRIETLPPERWSGAASTARPLDPPALRTRDGKTLAPARSRECFDEGPLHWEPASGRRPQPP